MNMYYEAIGTAARDNTHYSGGVVEWLTRRTSNLRIASRMGSNPVKDKPLFPWARNYAYCLVMVGSMISRFESVSIS